MSIADGEYDIDLSQLLAEPTGESGDTSFAIRYGFIPDSMDQRRPLKLYQTDKECLLQAFSNDSSSSSRPIIFEGAPQSHRKTSNPALNSYYLSFARNEDEEASSPRLQLRRLNSTIRVSKSRNAAKWEGKLAQWDKQGQSQGPIQFPQIEHKPEKPASSKSSSSSSKLQRAPAKQTSSSSSSQSKKASAKLTSSSSSSEPQSKKASAKSKPPGSKKSAPPQISSKRPPTATPEPKNDIISESDFEDLDGASNSADFPMIVLDSDSESPKPSKPHTKPLPSKSKASAKQKSKKIIEERKPQSTEEINIEDDFKDLEDQLQEVLQEEEEASTKESSNEPEPSPSSPQENNFNKNNVVNSSKNTDDSVNRNTEDMGKMAIDTQDRASQRHHDARSDERDDDDDDDESDSERYAFSGGPVIINFDDDSNSKPNPYKQTYGSTAERKPMSLRELYGGADNGGDKDADMSSSEAE